MPTEEERQTNILESISAQLVKLGDAFKEMNDNLSDIRIMLRADLDLKSGVMTAALEDFENSMEPLDNAESCCTPEALCYDHQKVERAKMGPGEYLVPDDFPKETRSYKFPKKDAESKILQELERKTRSARDQAGLLYDSEGD